MEQLSDAAKKYCILCVDTDRQWLNIMMRELKAVGVQDVVGTADPAEALTCIRDDDPDLLITDFNLKFVRFLRHGTKSPNRTIPIIVVTAKLSESEISAMRDAGVNEIAAKPCSVARLVERIEAIAAHPRPFVSANEFVGPSRRRKLSPISGPDRRLEG